MKVYLDRNIFGDIKQLKDSAESAGRVAALHNAVNEKRITILLSTTILEETLPVLKHSHNTLKQELEVIFGLVEKHRMIKVPGSLLKEAVQSYAFDRRLPDMLTRTPRILEDFLSRGKVSPALKEFVEAVVAQGSEFADDFTQTFSEVRRVGEERNVGTPDDFQEFWRAATPVIVEGLAEQHGVYERCAERGMEGLLEVKTVRLYATYYAAWVFAKWFGEQGVPGKVKPSERGDFFHSVQSAAADVFVTRDARLARWLKLIPVENFEVISLDQLLERLA